MGVNWATAAEQVRRNINPRTLRRYRIVRDSEGYEYVEYIDPECPLLYFWLGVEADKGL